VHRVEREADDVFAGDIRNRQDRTLPTSATLVAILSLGNIGQGQAAE
jgi:hypothetical protein